MIWKDKICITGTLWGWIHHKSLISSLAKVNNVDVFYFSSFNSYWTKSTVELPVIWDGIMLMWNHHNVCKAHVMKKLDMSTARQRLKSPHSLSGTSAHPTMVTLVNIMVMNGWLTPFLFHVNRPSYSWDKAISDFDLEISTPGSSSWAWSKGKVIQSAQYPINSLRFHFTSIRPTIPEIWLK